MTALWGDVFDDGDIDTWPVPTIASYTYLTAYLDGIPSMQWRFCLLVG